MRLLSVVLALLVSGAAAAADTTPQPAQPSAPVSKPASADTTNPPASATKSTADSTKPTSAKPAPDPKADDKTKDGDFKPSEQVSEDQAVAYPVDI
jgi:hypothetical protein